MDALWTGHDGANQDMRQLEDDEDAMLDDMDDLVVSGGVLRVVDEVLKACSKATPPTLGHSGQTYPQPTSQDPAPLERGDTIPATPPPPSPKAPKRLADILAGLGIRVRDFAYEDTGLPPVPPYKPPPRFYNQPLRHSRQENCESSHRIRSQPLQRIPTEPDLDYGPTSQPTGGLTREMGYADFADYQPSSQGLWMEPMFSQSQPTSQPLPSFLSASQNALRDSQSSQEDIALVATPFVTPNGSYVWPPKENGDTGSLDLGVIHETLEGVVERGRTLSRTSLGGQSQHALTSTPSKTTVLSSPTSPFSIRPFTSVANRAPKTPSPEPEAPQPGPSRQSPRTRNVNARQRNSPGGRAPHRGSHFIRQSISRSPLPEEESGLGVGRYHLRRRRASPPYPPPVTSAAAAANRASTAPNTRASSRKRTGRPGSRARESSRTRHVHRGEAMVIG